MNQNLGHVFLCNALTGFLPGYENCIVRQFGSATGEKPFVCTFYCTCMTRLLKEVHYLQQLNNIGFIIS